jgi:hypothetical protein
MRFEIPRTSPRDLNALLALTAEQGRLTARYRLQISQLERSLTASLSGAKMDLQAAERAEGKGGVASRIGALVCLVVACGLLVAPMFSQTLARSGQVSPSQTTATAAVK